MQTIHDRGSRLISSEPVINWLHRHLFALLLAGYTLGVIYLSFVPFDFVRNHRPVVHPWAGLSLHPYGLADAFANVALYIPLGALGFSALRRLGTGVGRAAMIPLACGPAMSLGIEWCQQWTASRVPSWPDVMANSLGTMVGVFILIGFERPLRRAAYVARESARRNWWAFMATGAVVAVMAAQLRPYDIVVDPLHTAAHLRHADWSVTAAWDGLPSQVAREVQLARRSSIHDLSRVRWEYALDRVCDSIAYAAVAALCVVATRRRWGRVQAIGAAGAICIGLSAAVTAIRVFLMSHGLDTSQVACGLAGWIAGSAIAIGCIRAVAADDRATPTFAWPRAIVLMGCSFVVMAVVTYGLVPFEFTIAGVAQRLRHATLVPFFGHLQSRPNDAFYDISGDLLRYVLMGACVAIVTARATLNWRTRMRAGVLLSIGTSAAIEFAHLFMPTRHADVTSVLLAGVGAFSGVVVVQWLADYRRSLVVVVEDLLTRQLISGPSYDKSATVPLRGSRPRDASPMDRAESNRPR